MIGKEELRMDRQELMTKLRDKEAREGLVTQALEDPSLISGLLDIIREEEGSIPFPCTKILRLASQARPEAVYPCFEEIARLLGSGNSFIRWDAMAILANLTAVDQDDRFTDIYEGYFSLLKDSQMITAGNVIGNAWKIIQARPRDEGDITRRLLAVPGQVFLHQGQPSPECSRVLCGHLLDAFDHYAEASHYREEILAFARGQLDSPRKALARKAARFLKRHAPPA